MLQYLSKLYSSKKNVDVVKELMDHDIDAAASSISKVEIDFSTSKNLNAFSSLPNEILESIFILCVPQCIADILSNTVVISPTRLCLVCRRWRDIIQASAHLWCVVGLKRAQMSLGARKWSKDMEGMDDRRHRALEYIRCNLERSKITPLSVGIWIEGCYPSDKRLVDAILATFIGCANNSADALARQLDQSAMIGSRLQELHISFDNIIDFRRPMKIREDLHFPQLRSINIAFHDTFGEARDPNFLSEVPPEFTEQLPCRSPSLTNFVWRGFACHNVLHTLLLVPPVNLTNLEIEAAIEPSICFNILSSFPLLESCVFNGILASTTREQIDEQVLNAIYPDFTPRIILYHLKCLILTSAFQPLIILTRLTAPRINTLALISRLTSSDGLNETKIWASTLSEFLERSSVSYGTLIPPVTSGFGLRMLEKHNFSLSPDKYENILRLSPFLEHLSLHQSELSSYDMHTNALLQALARPQASGLATAPSTSASTIPSRTATRFLCPNLRTLRLRGAILAQDGFLAHLIQDRLENLADQSKLPLERIHVELQQGRHQIDQEILANLSPRAKEIGKDLIVKLKVYRN